MKLAAYYLISYMFQFLLQAESSVVDKGLWSFSFPKVIKALKNSDVKIPCTFTAPINHSEVNVIWFQYQTIGYPQVFNSKNPTEVIKEYSGRTSLIANGTDSCTLRIKDVTKTDRFYPGISEEINSYKLHDNQNVQVKVTGCYEDKSCNDWTFRFPHIIVALKGSCVEIPCTFTHPEDAKDFNFFWYSQQGKIIFNNKTPSDVEDEYKGRTFLTGKTENDCSLKILNVEKSEKYFPGINDEINSNKLMERKDKVNVKVLEKPPKLLIAGTENMEDKKTYNISCSVNNSCPSNPPTITWNITGHPIMARQDLSIVGDWTSIMTYTASYKDDNALLGCAATFPNNKTSVENIKLNIKYRPRNITISVEGNKITQEGDNVTLLCSSQANPPVTNYSWYQISQGRKLFQAQGDEISVKNTTQGKYICVATNEIGAEESYVFTLAKQSQNGRVIWNAAIGSVVGLAIIFVLIALFYIFRRKTKTSVLEVMSTEKTEQVGEEIPMSDHLYGNIDQQQRATPSQSTSELQDSSHIYNNTDVEESKPIEKTVEEQSADSEQVFYTLLELPTPGQELPRTSVQTEYATLKHYIDD